MIRRITLLGGRFTGCKVVLIRQPERLAIAGVAYVRITDPDTGKLLGYVAVEASGPQRR